nr:MAG TPA_asm: hypothetical protein [Caudoviricetes sp.]
MAAHLDLVNDNNKSIIIHHFKIHKTVWQSISIPQA